MTFEIIPRNPDPVAAQAPFPDSPELFSSDSDKHAARCELAVAQEKVPQGGKQASWEVKEACESPVMMEPYSPY